MGLGMQQHWTRCAIKYCQVFLHTAPFRRRKVRPISLFWSLILKGSLQSIMGWRWVNWNLVWTKLSFFIGSVLCLTPTTLPSNCSFISPDLADGKTEKVRFLLCLGCSQEALGNSMLWKRRPASTDKKTFVKQHAMLMFHFVFSGIAFVWLWLFEKRGQHSRGAQKRKKKKIHKEVTSTESVF